MELDMAEIHAVEIRLLKAVVALCEKHGLRYSIYCGTLLGAVRHKGFIPWDDDVDLEMPLPDYRRFLAVSDELPEGIVCNHAGNTRDYPMLWAKVCADGTTFVERAALPMWYHMGISLDIYPMIGAARTERGKRLQKKLLKAANALRWGSYYRYVGSDDVRLRRLARIPAWLRLPVSDLLLRLSLRDPDRSERIGTLDGERFDGKFERKDWDKLRPYPFEDMEVMGPVCFCKILCMMYGNYWLLPPPEARKGHISASMIVDPHRDYRLYRRELTGR